MEALEAPLKEKSYYTRDGRNLLGPYSRAELALQLQQGQLGPDDLVQMEGLPLWQPVRVILATDEPRDAAESDAGDETPDWPVLLPMLGRRLRQEIEAPSVAAAVACLIGGTLALLLLRASALFWLPWFAGALVLAALLILQRRLVTGLLLVLGALAIPYLLLPDVAPRRAPVLAEAPEPARSAPVPLPPPPVAPPIPAPAPEATPALSVTPTAIPPAPEPIAAITPAPPPPPPAPAALPPTARPMATGAPLPIASATPAVSKSAPFPINNPALPAPSIPTPPNFDPVSAGDFVQAHSGALVVIRGSNGSGSGFVATQGGQPYLFTNIHVAADVKRPEFTLLDGTRLQPVSAEAAAGHDIMRFHLNTPPRQTIPASTDMGSQVRVGDDVFVLGNSGGGGVVTNLPGKIVGIGPDRIEVSSEFIPGNSGSPIVHARTGEVIGIATYLIRRYDEFANSNAAGPNAQPGALTVRRFGYRLDSVQRWEPVNWTVFRTEAEQLRQVSELSEDIFNFLDALRNKRVPSFATETLGRPATDWRQKISRAHLSQADRLQATQSFLGSLRSMVHNDVASLEGRIHYSYFRDDLEKEMKVRDRLYKAFDQDSMELAMPSMRGF